MQIFKQNYTKMEHFTVKCSIYQVCKVVFIERIF